MTDYPIPDELRDRFAAVFGGPRCSHRSAFIQVPALAEAVRDLNAAASRGCIVTIQNPEFEVHDETCCGEHAWQEQPLGSVCECDAHESPLPCPGIGYYHWTVSE